MATIEEVQNQIIGEMQSLDSQPYHMIQYIMELGQNLPPLSAKERIPEHAIDGCLSKVWLIVDDVNGYLRIRGDSNALFTKGLLALLITIFSNQPPEAIVHSKLLFPEALNLSSLITPQRQEGLQRMWEKIQTTAKAYL